MAALPWIYMGIALALWAVNYQIKQDKQSYDNYIAEGMCLGICFGLILGSQHLTLGMFLGTVIGMCIRKSGNRNESKW